MPQHAVLLRIVITATALLVFGVRITAQRPDELKSRAELSNYEETSRYDDVIRFITELQKQSDLVRITSFGRSEEGRALPLVILSNPPVSDPRQAMASGKPVVFVMANIHAGEVEGKEAAQHLARRMIAGDLRSLPDKLVVLIAPIYNADGNERIAVTNRTDQNGPVAGVGTRENSKGFDLNRDYIKLDTAEARSLVGMIARWDPALTIDLHTTDGSYHGYHLTYSPTLNPNADPRLLSFERDMLLPSITQTMLRNHKFRTYYYGNFSTREAMDSELNTPSSEGTPIWRTFDHRPRFGNNYVGLRNRLTILSEAYSHLDFRGRVAATEAFVEEILKYSAAHAPEILRLIQTVDRDAVQRQVSRSGERSGVAFELRPLPRPVDLLVGEVSRIRNPRNGRDMIAMVEDKFKPQRMPDYGQFAAVRSTAMPRAYVLRRAPDLERVVDNLRVHGVIVEELTEAASLEVETFDIADVARSERPFQNHNEISIKGALRRENLNFPAGSLVVRTAQPLGPLVFYLLEPESDDGLTVWNFFDSYLGKARQHPVHKLMTGARFASRILPQ